MLIRREVAEDVEAIRAVTKAAFTTPDNPEPVEAPLVDWLRADDGWLPPLSMVAVNADGDVIGHVVCTRGWIKSNPALGLGPLSVAPLHQRAGVGSALMHAVLGAADAMGESIVVLLGSPEFYSRFGFRHASELEIDSPDPQYGRYFQARALTAYDGTPKGLFTYAEPFSRL